MKTNNLEFELRKFEMSQWDDKKNYEKHTYNGFLGIEGYDAFHRYLDELYHNYFSDLRIKIDNLIMSNNNNLILKYLEDKKNIFNTIKDDFELKSNLDYWNNYIVRCETVDAQILERSHGARNEYTTVKFFREMINTQLYFIEKGIDELKLLHETYGDGETNPNKQNTTQKPLQQNSIKEKFHYVDEYFNQYTDKDILINKDIEYIFDIDRATVINWRKKGKLVQISEDNKRPILYSKSDIIDRIKDGVLPHRLTSIKHN